MSDEPDEITEDETSDGKAQRGEPQGDPHPSVTGRPNDVPLDEPAPAPLGGNSTFADRAKAKPKDTKQVDADTTEDKAVTSATTKRRKSK